MENNQLITIGRDQMVCARELHKFLEIKTRFNDWINTRIKEYDLVQGVDYIILKTQYNDIADLRVTLDTAKELSMVEKNPKGKQARQFFIAAHNELLRIQKSKTPLELLQDSITLAIEQERRTRALESRQDRIEEKILLLASDSEYATLRGYCRIQGVKISEKEAAMLGKRTSSVCKQKGLHIGSVADERHGSVNSYPKHILGPIVTAWQAGVLT